jgi:methionyl-tRNA formyltransferase
MKIIFAGTPQFGLPALDALMQSGHSIIGIFTQPDKPAGRGRHLQQSPFKQFALSHQLPLFQPASLKNTEQQEIIKHLSPDVMIVAAYGLILPKAVLEIPTLGCINIHASLLPRYRGAAPIQRAILSGASETGITIMQMDEGLDTGKMLYKLSCQIENIDNVQTLHDKLSQLGATALIHVINHLENITPEVQNNDFATYASKIVKSESLLDFNKTAIECDRAVRAFYPAQILFKDQLIKIWETQVINPERLGNEQSLGKIIHADKSGIDFVTKQGILRCLQLQMPGGKKLFAQEILNSRGEFFKVC